MQVKQASLQILSQLSKLVKQINDVQYVESSYLLLGSSIGQHTRHILEFYDIFIHSYYTGIVNYDQREHSRVIEENRKVALLKLEELIIGINKIQEDFSIKLLAAYSTDKTEPSSMSSSVLRELAYNLEHAIHHMAFIKMAVVNQYPQIDIPEDFGVAFSTRRFKKTTK